MTRKDGLIFKDEIYGQQRLREYRQSFEGLFYFITTRALPGIDLAQSLIVDEIFSALRYLEEHNRIEWICGVVMPDHLHVVLKLLKGCLADLMHSLKSFTALRINKILNRKGPLWQRAYYDHLIRRPEEMDSILSYCKFNPVRKGLVEATEEYPY